MSMAVWREGSAVEVPPPWRPGFPRSPGQGRGLEGKEEQCWLLSTSPPKWHTSLPFTFIGRTSLTARESRKCTREHVGCVVSPVFASDQDLTFRILLARLKSFKCEWRTVDSFERSHLIRFFFKDHPGYRRENRSKKAGEGLTRL